MWYFDSGNGDCMPFAYTGCGGNENRFPSRSACRETCRPQPQDPAIKSGPIDPPLEVEQPSPDSPGEVEPWPSLPEIDMGALVTPETPRDTLATFPPLQYNLNNFTPQSVGRLNTSQHKNDAYVSLR